MENGEKAPNAKWNVCEKPQAKSSEQVKTLERRK